MKMNEIAENYFVEIIDREKGSEEREAKARGRERERTGKMTARNKRRIANRTNDEETLNEIRR